METESRWMAAWEGGADMWEVREREDRYCNYLDSDSDGLMGTTHTSKLIKVFILNI